MGLGLALSSRLGRGFNPLTLSPALWLDSSDPSTLYQDSALTTLAVADADPVGGWKDKSGNGRNVTQATGAARPTLRLAVQNGRPVLRFDGTDDTLLFSGGALDLARNVAEFTIAGVFKSTDATNNRVALTLSVGTATTARVRAVVNDAGQVGVWGTGGRRLDADSLVSVNGGSVSTTLFSQITARYNLTNTTCQLYKDGTLAASNTSYQTAGSTSDTASQVGTIGSVNSSTNFWLGDISEILLFRRAITETDRVQLATYLKQKWSTP